MFPALERQPQRRADLPSLNPETAELEKQPWVVGERELTMQTHRARCRECEGREEVQTRRDVQAARGQAQSTRGTSRLPFSDLLDAAGACAACQTAALVAGRLRRVASGPISRSACAVGHRLYRGEVTAGLNTRALLSSFFARQTSFPRPSRCLHTASPGGRARRQGDDRASIAHGAARSGHAADAAAEGWDS
ncbi:uncharacterized protein BDZ99DRAFT_482249 [Mytilinidion resinicola]|uniref:Uncharacterized protein n=1 Tax=Mytilinidion resinicola TaxID=574789 RepID=A0A6A6Y5A9_9PEZI|nr:uncharacterized protein BDZ99DRAFT_482249 [Mytilinidion resinicola]KAF2803415.1 hypothetical protein BDZ99DRAFT_482249 [Mytilinidion resinicola]